MQKEEWRSVVGYEGYYEVSSEGRIKNRHGLIVKPSFNEQGYLQYPLSKNRSIKTCKVHRIVATAFISNKENKKCVNHIDNNPSNNHVSNLEWCTHKENSYHSIKQNRRVNHIGEKNGQSKLTSMQVSEILKSNLPQKELGKMYGVTQANISIIKTRNGWKNVELQSE